MNIKASFKEPEGIVIDKSANIFVTGGNKVRKITLDGKVITFVGSGKEGSADGVGTTASFKWPTGLAIDKVGNFYVSDFGNNKIRKITSNGKVTTVAGSGKPGFKDGKGTSASFNGPQGIAVDSTGNLYVADFNNNAIRKITPDGTISTFATTGVVKDIYGKEIVQKFCFPRGIAIDKSDNIYIVDTANYV